MTVQEVGEVGLLGWACPAFFDLLPLTPTWSQKLYLGAPWSQPAQPPCQRQPSGGGGGGGFMQARRGAGLAGLTLGAVEGRGRLPSSGTAKPWGVALCPTV